MAQQTTTRLRTTLPTRRSSSARLIVVPGKIRMITKFPRLNEMRSQEHRAQQDANTAHNKVCDTEERVLAAHDSARRDEDRFGTAVLVDGEAYTHMNISVLSLKEMKGRRKEKKGTK
jgi:hypothetical protein